MPYETNFIQNIENYSLGTIFIGYKSHLRHPEDLCDMCKSYIPIDNELHAIQIDIIYFRTCHECVYKYFSPTALANGGISYKLICNSTKGALTKAAVFQQNKF